MPRSYPDSQAILGVAVDYLEAELYPKLSGVDRYRSRVAINALRIVQRELALGSGFDATEQSALRALLGDGPQDAPLGDVLAAEIRQGDRSLDDPALIRFLQDSLKRALAINNPKWTEGPPAS